MSDTLREPIAIRDFNELSKPMKPAAEDVKMSSSPFEPVLTPDVTLAEAEQGLCVDCTYADGLLKQFCAEHEIQYRDKLMVDYPPPAIEEDPDPDDKAEQDVAAREKSMPMSSSPTQPKQQGVDFAEVIRLLNEGKQVTKLEWNDTDVYLAMRNDKDGRWLSLHKKDGSWHCLQVKDGDMLGTDWVVL